MPSVAAAPSKNKAGVNLRLVIPNIVAPAMDLLPPRMDGLRAQAMLLAIGLQESGFRYREQMNGPARGYWQFEQRGGVHGVRSQAATKSIIEVVLSDLDYAGLNDSECLEAITHNDILAACFARLLLWTLPEPLPSEGEYDESWSQYLAAWRPGKPRRDSWTDYYRLAWDTVNQ